MTWTTAHVTQLLSIGERGSVTPQEHDALTGMGLLTDTTEALLSRMRHSCIAGSTSTTFPWTNHVYLNSALDLPIRLLLPPHDDIPPPPTTAGAALRAYRHASHRPIP